MFAKTICLALLVSGVLAEELQAIVKLQGEGIEGIIRFRKVGDTVEGKGKISGLKEGHHGFHVHQFGDLSNGCASTGGHFNPHNKTHGAPSDDDRHVGDLGNVVAEANGEATVYFVDKLIDLQGEHCIIGRAVVVHADVDDLGKGNHKDSLTTGNAGGRVACGVIGILSEPSSSGSIGLANISTQLTAAVIFVHMTNYLFKL